MQHLWECTNNQNSMAHAKTQNTNKNAHARPTDTSICITAYPEFKFNRHGCTRTLKTAQNYAKSRILYDLPNFGVMCRTCPCLQLFPMNVLEHETFSPVSGTLRTRYTNSFMQFELVVAELCPKNRPKTTNNFGPNRCHPGPGS